MSETPQRPDPASPPPMPRWVKISIAIFIGFILIVIALHLAGVDFGHMQHMR